MRVLVGGSRVVGDATVFFVVCFAAADICKNIVGVGEEKMLCLGG